jgi:2'-hydroxyisoflavone reductase
MGDYHTVDLLILGGTRFLGRAAAEAALARGHELTLFNRGETNPGLFPEAEHLRGDRDGDLSALEGRSWDAVIDPSGYVPRIVRASAELLAGSVGHYVFVSSISVYAEPVRAGFDESAPTIELDDPTIEDIRASAEAYGGLKVLCERTVAELFPQAHTVVRPGLIVGPNDPTGRFTYWVVRLSRGGDLLAPGDPERRVQVIDVRDLGAWLVDLAEQRITGTFNAVGPTFPMRQLLETAREAAGTDGRPVWVDEAFLLERDVGQWTELPLWVGAADNGFLEGHSTRARDASLHTRPLARTVRDTLAWAREHDAALVTSDAHGANGMDPARERELLADWASSR